MILQDLKAARLYFILVFGAGFMLGTLRVIWLVPRVGERAAERMECPSCWWSPHSLRVGLLDG